MRSGESVWDEEEEDELEGLFFIAFNDLLESSFASRCER